MPPVNGSLGLCKERASAKKWQFPNETRERAAQLLLVSPRAAQILRACVIMPLFLNLAGTARCDVHARQSGRNERLILGAGGCAAGRGADGATHHPYPAPIPDVPTHLTGRRFALPRLRCGLNYPVFE